MSRPSNNGGEDSSGSVITGETSLAHAGAIVNNLTQMTYKHFFISIDIVV
jgi:hypothetical protein